METHDVRLPNGRVIKNVPLGTSKTEVMRKAVENGIATYQDFGEDIDPTEGESFGKLAMEGAGKAFSDAWRGIKQTLNVGDQEALQADIDASRERDAPLMQSAGGVTGNVAGNIAMAVPSVAVPGANTVAGSAALGALYGGAATPTATGESAVDNAVGAGLVGGGTQLALRSAPAVFRAITRPFHKSGRERIAAEAIERFATNPVDATPQSNVPGVRYTLAEATQDPGLATLERGARNLDPTIAGQMGEREMANVGAVRNALSGIAGDDAAMAAAKEARNAIGSGYDDILRNAVIHPDEALTSVLQRPAAQEAMERAATLAREADIPEPTAAEWLHYTKMALDDMLDPRTGGIVGNQANAVRNTRNAVTDWLNKNVEGYSGVREAYKEASRPINEMQVGRYLSDKLNPALNDFQTSIPNTRPAMYANALRNADAMVKKATDFGGANVRNTMSPQNMEALEGIGEYFARREGARNLGRAAGTNTAQNLTSSNLLRNIAGPLGIPETFVESTLARSVAQPVGLLMKPAEEATQEVLVRALMDPDYARTILANATPSKRQALVQALLSRALPAASVGLGASAVTQ